MGAVIGKYSNLSGEASLEVFLCNVRSLILYLVYIGNDLCPPLFLFQRRQRLC